jgi:anti-sigma28 factor (negative regulator of flagellin synthesis)
MKVNDPNLSGTPPTSLGGAGPDKTQETERLRRGGRTNRGDPAVGDAPDRVSLSELGGQLRSLSVDSPERAARLEKLNADVRAGRYHADPLDVSRSLIERMLAERMNPGGTSDQPLRALEQARACLLSPSASNLEQASSFLHELDGQLRARAAPVSQAEATCLIRQMADMRRLAEQAAGFYLALTALLKSRPVSYAATGDPAIPAGHQLSVEG